MTIDGAWGDKLTGRIMADTVSENGGVMKKIWLSVGCLLVLVNTAFSQQFLLTSATAPSSMEILPPPPANDSLVFGVDKAVAEQKFLHHTKKRWLQAKKDAALSGPADVLAVFKEALALPISPKNAPAVYRVVAEIMHDEPLATNSAKKHYMRKRPFMYFHQHTCDPAWEDFLSHNGSYPSGHTTIGWAVALALAEIHPARQDEILKRGYEYGQSRVICGAHWQSDVNEGRVVGSALFASLQAKPRFRQWMQDAHEQLERLAARRG